MFMAISTSITYVISMSKSMFTMYLLIRSFGPLQLAVLKPRWAQGDWCLRVGPGGVDLNRNWDEHWEAEGWFGWQY